MRRPARAARPEPRAPTRDARADTPPGAGAGRRVPDPRVRRHLGCPVQPAGAPAPHAPRPRAPPPVCRLLCAVPRAAPSIDHCWQAWGVPAQQARRDIRCAFLGHVEHRVGATVGAAPPSAAALDARAHARRPWTLCASVWRAARAQPRSARRSATAASRPTRRAAWAAAATICPPWLCRCAASRRSPPRRAPPPWTWHACRRRPRTPTPPSSVRGGRCRRGGAPLLLWCGGVGLIVRFVVCGPV